MRKIVFTCLSIVFVQVAYSQMVTFEGETNVIYGTSSNASEELDAGWQVTNNSSSTLIIRCSAHPEELVEGAKYQYCWGTLCSAWLEGNGNLPESVTLAPGESSETFHVKYRHYGNAGQSIICFNWYEYGNPSNSHEFCMNFCVDGECVVGVSEARLQGNIGEISPNPVVKSATISYDFSALPHNATIRIFNMVGTLVKEIAVIEKSGAVVVEASEFENGIYFCSIQNAGKVFETKRLVIAK